ncbi:hypothetical protein ABGB14_08615 [Nonomuraea sp. B10E15]|uniref:hypothetical protein n=1 Tax=unclassified Nonomuraea TaxID=2593643 RepID=UPI00325C471A
MSDAFKIPAPGASSSTWMPFDQADLRDMQYATLAMLAYGAAVFPQLKETVVLTGLTLPSDPHELHRVADGWSSFGYSVYGAGRTGQQLHDDVSPASWQAPERDQSGQQMAGFVMESDSDFESAEGLAFLLRCVANVSTAGIYFRFLLASWLVSNLVWASLVGGPPTRLNAILQAERLRWLFRDSTSKLQSFLAKCAVRAGIATFTAGYAHFGLGDGFEPSWAEGQEGGTTANV